MKKKTHWISWNLVIASKEKCGIQIGSLDAPNFALLLKWRWRYVDEKDAFWATLISDICGKNRKNAFDVTYGRGGGVWASIVGTINTMHEKGIVPLSSLKKQVGDCRNTSFWFDICLGEISLKM